MTRNVIFGCQGVFSYPFFINLLSGLGLIKGIAHTFRLEAYGLSKSVGPETILFNLSFINIFVGFVNRVSSKSLKNYVYRLMTIYFGKQLCRLVSKVGDPDAVIFTNAGSASEIIECFGGRNVWLWYGNVELSTEFELAEQEVKRFGFIYDGNASRAWLLERIRSECLLSNRIFVCSDLTRFGLINSGVDSKKIVKIPPPLEMSSWDRVYNQSVLNNTGGEEVFKIVHVSNMSMLKGVQYLLIAFARLLRISNARLVLIGPKPSGPLLELIKRSGVEDSIVMAGKQDHSSMRIIMSGCDVACIPSVCDGWASTVNEAMALGLPTIVSEGAGASELIIHNRNGLKVPSQDSDAIFDSLLKLLRDENLRYRMGVEGRITIQRVLDRSQIEKIILAELNV